MADSFFQNFQAAVEASPEPEPALAAPAAEAAEKKPGWFRRLIGKKA
jgi:hypothetical protein